MGHSCCVPGCNSGKSNTASGSISFFRLPLKNKPLLRRWIANIGKKKLPAESRICSLHFVNGKKEGTEVPVLNLPKPPLYKNPAKRKQPCERLVLYHCAESISHTEQLEPKLSSRKQKKMSLSTATEPSPSPADVAMRPDPSPERPGPSSERPDRETEGEGRTAVFITRKAFFRRGA